MIYIFILSNMPGVPNQSQIYGIKNHANCKLFKLTSFVPIIYTLQTATVYAASFTNLSIPPFIKFHFDS